MYTIALRGGERVKWENGMGVVMEDKGDMVDVIIEGEDGYTFEEIKKSNLFII